MESPSLDAVSLTWAPLAGSSASPALDSILLTWHAEPPSVDTAAVGFKSGGIGIPNLFGAYAIGVVCRAVGFKSGDAGPHAATIDSSEGNIVTRQATAFEATTRFGTPLIHIEGASEFKASGVRGFATETHAMMPSVSVAGALSGGFGIPAAGASCQVTGLLSGGHGPHVGVVTASPWTFTSTRFGVHQIARDAHC